MKTNVTMWLFFGSCIFIGFITLLSVGLVKNVNSVNFNLSPSVRIFVLIILSRESLSFSSKGTGFRFTCYLFKCDLILPIL